MAWQYLFYISALFIVAGLTLVLTSLAWQRRRTWGVDLFIGLALATTIWASATGVEHLVTSLGTKILLSKIQYFGIASVPVFWLLFCMAYTRQDNLLGRRGRWLLWLIPMMTIILVWSNEHHRLIWIDVKPAGPHPGALTVYSHGLWFWVNVAYSYTLILTGAVLLVRAWLRSPYLYRKQATSLLVGFSIPLIGNILYIFGYTPIPGLDLTPPAFLISTLIVGWSLFRFRLLELSPIAQDAIFDNLLDGILVLSPEGLVSELNSRAARMLEVAADASIGQPVQSVVPEWPALEDAFSRKEHGREEAVSVEIELARNVRRSLEIRRALLKDPRQGAMGTLIILRDITLRKEQEQTMKIQSVALEAAADGIVITDPDGAIIWTNPAFTQITGYTFNEASRQNLRILKSGRQESAFYDNMWRTIKSGNVWRGEIVNRHKDGHLYDEELTITPVLDGQGQINHFIAIKQDISSRKTTEEALRRSNLEKQRLIEAEAIAQERNRIAQEIHDGLAQTLAALRMRVRRWRHYLEDQPERMREEVKDVEDLVNASMLEARRSIYALRPLALADQGFFAALQQFTRGLGDYYQMKVYIDVAGSEDCLPRHLELTLFRLIQEALNNTAKHASAQNAWIHIDLNRPEAVTLVVRDDGQGFDPGQVTKAGLDGGLGLQAMRERVLAANGEIRLESHLGAGTEVHITFPLNER